MKLRSREILISDCIKMAAIDLPECLDFLHFQELLKKMRLLDDKIIYTMNTLPTESFKEGKDCNASCKEIYEQLESNNSEREKTIQKCIKYTSERVHELKKKKENNSNDTAILKALRKEQVKLKMLHTELGVEEVVRDKSRKVYYERCRQFYVPPNLLL